MDVKIFKEMHGKKDDSPKRYGKYVIIYNKQERISILK